MDPVRTPKVLSCLYVFSTQPQRQTTDIFRKNSSACSCSKPKHLARPLRSFEYIAVHQIHPKTSAVSGRHNTAPPTVERGVTVTSGTNGCNNCCTLLAAASYSRTGLDGTPFDCRGAVLCLRNTALQVFGCQSAVAGPSAESTVRPKLWLHTCDPLRPGIRVRSSYCCPGKTIQRNVLCKESYLMALFACQLLHCSAPTPRQV